MRRHESVISIVMKGKCNYWWAVQANMLVPADAFMQSVIKRDGSAASPVGSVAQPESANASPHP